jgi:peroxisomal 2,4-dienoyl-CoA reductase
MSIFREGLFDGRVALITGGGTGIGRGITDGLASLGAKTAILSRKAEHLGPAASAVAAHFGRECLPVVADVRQPDQVEAAVAKVVDAYGRIDLLVNAAAGNFFCPSAELSPNGFGTVVDIDAKGTWNVTRAAFHAALGPLGIRVNAIAPGPIGNTEGARRLFPGQAAERLRSVIPTRRVGTIEDIVNLALFLLSEAAANISGAVVVSDGGLCLIGSFGLGIEATPSA